MNKGEMLGGILYSFKCLKCDKLVAWPSALDNNGTCAECRLVRKDGQVQLSDFTEKK